MGKSELWYQEEAPGKEMQVRAAGSPALMWLGVKGHGEGAQQHGLELPSAWSAQALFCSEFDSSSWSHGCCWGVERPWYDKAL